MKGMALTYREGRDLTYLRMALESLAIHLYVRVSDVVCRMGKSKAD